MEARAPRTLGVVVVHRPGRPVHELPAVRDLGLQVDRLVIVHNGPGGTMEPPDALRQRVETIVFPVNRGTAAAWNEALRFAGDEGFEHLYLLDQDSVPGNDAVASASAAMVGGVAAVVQPVRDAGPGTAPFPWNTVASGSLYDVAALGSVGGFDERLFVDEVDHEALDRLLQAGFEVRQLSRPSIDHQVGSPRPVQILGRPARIFGHSIERQRLRGYSTGQLVRRYARHRPALAARLVLREAVLLTKEVAGGERGAAASLLAGLAEGASTAAPPAAAAERACPFCEGPLLGRYAQVPDWRFGAGAPADVYRCATCGAMGAGRVPAEEEIASWYAGYYTHGPESVRAHLWSAVWPTPARREEMEALRRYLAPPGTVGRFLEVGTGSGERLVEFAAAGWEVAGQDLDPHAGRVAREHGIEVHLGPVRDLVGREKPFDLIGLNHVLEHVSDPAGLLRDCAALLAPEGRICVVAPNADALGRLLFGRWWFGLEQPRHLSIPTLESLRRLADRAPVRTVHAEPTAANAAVVLGGSLARPLEHRLPPGRLRDAAGFLMHLAGQTLGRAAVLAEPRRGEELVWVVAPAADRAAGPG